MQDDGVAPTLPRGTTAQRFCPSCLMGKFRNGELATASVANLAFFKWFGVDQPAFCSPLQRLCAEIGRREIALRGDTRSSPRVVVDWTRETCDHRNLPAPWIPTRSSKPLRPLGHLLCGNDPLTSGRLIAGPRGGP